MSGHCILSHGLHSSPDASKVTAMAKVAESLGWSSERPDYRDLDASGTPDDAHRRVQRLVDAARKARQPLVLAGSSMGAWTSGLASLQVECVALFLMVPPVTLPHDLPRLDAASVPTTVVQAWHDELIPALDVVGWCRERSAKLILVDDTHRLESHVDFVAEEFGLFLRSLS